MIEMRLIRRMYLHRQYIGTKQPQMLSYDIISENSQKVSFLEIKIYLAKFKAITE